MPRPSSRAKLPKVGGLGEAENGCLFSDTQGSHPREASTLYPLRLQEGKWIYIFPLAGCKVESIFLNVMAVNTHRDRPQVAAGLWLGW